MQNLKHTLLLVIYCLGSMIAAAAPQGSGVVFGVVPSDSKTEQGLEIAAVAPGSPAARSGLQAGDILLSVNTQATHTRRDLLLAIHSHKPGDTITVRYKRGKNHAEAHVTLEARPSHPQNSATPTDPGYKEHGDRMVKLLNIPPQLLEQMRALKRDIRHALSDIEGQFVPADISEKLQQLRDLARDAQAHRHGWMSGRACEAYLQFHDDQGTLVLHGANNQLSLEVYDNAGQLLQEAPLNTQEQRQALAPELIERLQNLR